MPAQGVGLTFLQVSFFAGVLFFRPPRLLRLTTLSEYQTRVWCARGQAKKSKVHQATTPLLSVRRAICKTKPYTVLHAVRGMQEPPGVLLCCSSRVHRCCALDDWLSGEEFRC